MIKVCVTGNSHVAAFKHAQAAIKGAHPGFAVDFFGVAFPHVDGLACNADGVFGVDRALSLAAGIQPHRVRAAVMVINEHPSIDLSDYDAAFHVGQYVKVKDILRIIAGYDVDGFPDRNRPGRMSFAAFEAMVQEIVDDHIPDWIGNLAGATRAWASIVPFLSEACLADEGTEYEYLRATAPDAAAIGPIMAFVQDIIGDRFAALGVTYIPQRTSTTPQQVVTAAKHSVGSRRFGGVGETHDARDYIHMNAAYAASCFDEFAYQARAALAVGQGEKQGAMRAR